MKGTLVPFEVTEKNKKNMRGAISRQDLMLLYLMV
jgi:hypothetical protein